MQTITDEILGHTDISAGIRTVYWDSISESQYIIVDGEPQYGTWLYDEDTGRRVSA